MLSSSLEEMRLSVVRKLLDRDPSLALEIVTVDDRPQAFAMAALRRGCMSLVDASLSAGFDINQPVMTGMGQLTPMRSLLDMAVSANDLSATEWLLAKGASCECTQLGADGSEIPYEDVEPLLVRAFKSALYSQNLSMRNFGVALMLMDAGADVHLASTHPRHESPLVSICKAPWNGCETVMMRMIAALKERGANLDQKSPLCKLTPLGAAMGAKNLPALCTLIELGANTDMATSTGDFLQQVIDNGFQDDVPLIQAAIMRRLAREKMSTKPASAAAAVPAPPKVNRRAMPQI